MRKLDAHTIDTVNFEKGDGLVPAIVQDARTRAVLMLGFMSREALAETFRRGRVTFFSRTRQALWTKGETSGHYLTLDTILLDCDADALLIKATPAGPVCHTGTDTCWVEENTADPLLFLRHLEGVIHDRRVNPSAGSYTASLFEKGLNKIAQKVGEEAVELVIEAKDDDTTLFKAEAADLLFHLLVLLEAKGIALDEVLATLAARH